MDLESRASTMSSPQEFIARIDAGLGSLTAHLAWQTMQVYEQPDATAPEPLMSALRLLCPDLHAAAVRHSAALTARRAAQLEHEAAGRLATFRTLLASGSLLEALHLLEAVAADRGGDETAVAPFRAEVAALGGQAFERAIRVVPGPQSLSLEVQLTGSPGLAELWQLSDALGDIAGRVEGAAAAAFDSVILPYCEGSYADLTTTRDPSGSFVALTASGPAVSPPPVLDGTFTRSITAAVEALSEALLGSNPTLVALFGRKWAHVATSIVATRLTSSPGLGVTLEQAEAAVALAAGLESRLAALGLIDTSDPGSTRLSQAAQHLLDRTREEALGPLLSDIRDATSGSLHLEECPEGEGPTGRSVSRAAVATWAVTLHALEGACQTAADQGQSRAFTASLKAAVEGFARGLVQKREQDFKATRIALLHCSGCEWLSLQLQAYEKARVAKGIPYPPWLKTEAGRMASLLKRTSLEFAEREVGAALAEVSELLSPAAGFKDITDPDRNAAARLAVQQVLHFTGRVSKLLREPLSDRLFVHCATSLVEGVCRTIVRGLVTIGDLSVEESEELPRMLGPVADDLLGQVAKPGRGQSRAEVFEEVARHAASVGKLKMVLEVMRLKLSDIVAEWRAGSLRRRGLGREEVAALIESLFSDTALRRQALEAIASL